jgi:hypothetical protein
LKCISKLSQNAFVIARKAQPDEAIQELQLKNVSIGLGLLRSARNDGKGVFMMRYQHGNKAIV